MRHLGRLTGIWVVLVSLQAGAVPPAPGAGADGLRLPQDTNRWTCGGAAAPAQPIASGHGWTFPAQFSALDSGARAYWDATVDWDLSKADGVALYVFCPDPFGMADLVLHLHSGGGWYSVTLEVEAANAWWRARARKQNSRTEGNVLGWHTIDRVRISLWRAVDADAVIHVAGFAPLGNEKQPTAPVRLPAARSKTEFRGLWCSDAYGVGDWGWDETVRRVAEEGFNAILPNMAWAGKAYYAGAVLPAASVVAERGDALAQCLAACKKHGVACHVRKLAFNMGYGPKTAFMKQMQSAGRTQLRYDGTREERWLCPSHPENQKLEVAVMAEIARKYAVDGLHWDYIRYPDKHTCFCAGCRARFEKELGHKVTPWPGAIRQDKALHKGWRAFRRRQITGVVAAAAQAARAARSGIQMSAAVYIAWPRHREELGQDWKAWCDEGYVDFVCPMNYTPNNRRFEMLVRHQKQWAGTKPVYPGIGLSVWRRGDPLATLKAQLAVTRSLHTGGFTVFRCGEEELDKTLPAVAGML